MESILNGLNEQQKCAVTCPASVLQVLAPPGSGKTKTLTTRVAYHIAHEGLKPWNIIVCTFTTKAAREMKERIRSFVGNNLEAKLILGTFHSVARRYLVNYGHYIGIRKQFGIADSADTLAIIKRIVKRHDFATEPAKARSRISKRKSGMTIEQPVNSKLNTEQQEFEVLLTKYEEALQASNLLDYDDLLLQCVELLKRHPECVSNIEAVLIDEFQDTNHVQYQLMSLFAQHRKPRSNARIPTITIVGDPDQSIYSFRSAEIKNLKRMRSQYPDTQVVLLEDNYRSSGSILHSALEVIEQDQSRPAKKLLATHTTGERPVLRTLPSAPAEAAWLVSEIQRATILTAQLLTFSDFAILLRSASLSRHIESALGKAGIPYRMVGGHKFFDRVEVKIILDYLRVISQPDHNDALARILNTPSRKIGDVTIKSLLEEAEKSQKTLWSLVLDIAQGRRSFTTKISSQAQKGLEVFTSVILTSQNKLSNFQELCSVVELMTHIIRKLSYKDYLSAKYPEEIENRWANVEELVSQAAEMASQSNELESDSETLFAIDGVAQHKGTEAEETLNKFLANIALSSTIEAHTTGEDPNQVTISTIHAAKGLEWPVVFIPAAYQGSIPHSRAEDTDEERRLLYVGMTRAKSLLYLSHPKKSSTNEATTVSPFLSTPTVIDCFVTKGPSFGFSVSQEIARILGRVERTPSEAAIQVARSNIERVHDNLWPEDGEEIPTDNPRCNHQQLNSDPWTSNYSSDPLVVEFASKRQKTMNSDFVKASGIKGSLLSSEKFSIANTTMASGFVTAGIHLKEFGSQVAARETVQQSEKDHQKSEKQPPKIPSQKKKSANQGSIYSFFTKSSAVQPHPNKNENTAGLALVPQALKKREALLARQTTQQLKDWELETSSGSRTAPTTNQAINVSRGHTLPPRLSHGRRVLPVEQALPLQEITNGVRLQHSDPSQLLSAHKPKTAPTKRPKAVLDEELSTSQRHVLLSSSPTKPDEQIQGRGQKHVEIGQDAIVGGRSDDKLPQGSFTQATTFHTTTMARVSAQQHSSQRRTLGMRRSVQAWGSRVNQPFSAPSRTKSEEGE